MKRTNDPQCVMSTSEGRRSCGGQALTELLVVGTFVLVPLFLIIPVVAKLISQKQDVEIAARYAAWERTVWYEEKPGGLDGYEGADPAVKSDAEIAAEVDARIFSEDTRRIVSTTDMAYELDPFSRRQNGGRQPLLARSTRGNNGAGAEYATISARNREPDGLAHLTSGFADIAGFLGQFDLGRRGLYDATASVELTDLSSVFGQGLGVADLTLESNNALFTQSWAAGGRKHAEYRIQGLLPQQYLDNDLIATIQDIVALLPISKEINSDCLIFGHTTIEPLPVHRLEDIDSSIRGQGGSSCDL